MKYATLKRIAESNVCDSSGVVRKTTLQVVDSGAIETVTGVHYVHPVHIGRLVELTRKVSTSAVIDVKIVK